MGHTILHTRRSSGGGTMTKHMRGVHVAQVPVRAMLVTSVSVVSVLLSLLSSSAASALPLGADKLLSPVIIPITQLLPGGGTNQQPSQPGKGSASNTNATPSTSQSQHAANQSSFSPSSGNPDGTALVVEEMQPLDPVAPIDISDVKKPLLPLAYLASAKREPVPAVAVVRTTAAVTPPIQATEEGWRLFGVAWYWWLITVGALTFGIRYLFLSDRVNSLYSSAGQ